MQDYPDKKIRLLIAGECHAKRIIKSLDLPPYFEIVDISYGEGKIENYLETLDVFDFFEDDIFVLGGTSHDTNTTDIQYKNKTEKLIKTILTKYKNAKIIFWNAPVREDHGAYNKTQMMFKIKEELANNKNIFTKTITLSSEHFHVPAHYNFKGNELLIKQLKEFILENKESLYKQKYEMITPSLEMSFPENDSVVFILDYKEEIPVEIHAEYHDGLRSTFLHHSGKNLIPDRKNIFKLKNLKHILFPPNIVNLKCQIKFY
jgi:hypothetical protein